MRLFLSVSILIPISLVLFVSIGSHAQHKHDNGNMELMQAVQYRYFVHKNDTGAWYFSIKKNEKLIVMQKDIPAVQGNIAFVDSLQASKIARLMVDKLEQGVFPPSVFRSDLDSLKIIY